jgi:hypothetical protein
MVEKQKAIPKVPSAAPVAGKAAEEFDTLKRSLNEMPSWEMTPNNWDRIQIAYTKTGTEQQARSFLKAVELPTPDM